MSTEDDSPLAALGLSAEEAEELIAEFLAESRDLIADAEPTLLEIEAASQENGVLDEDLVNKAFRAFHSLKGSAGVLGFARLVKVTHEAEFLLDHFRSSGDIPTADHVSTLCRALDMASAALDSIESSMNDAAIEDGFAEMIETLQQMTREAKEGKGAAAVEDSAEEAAPAAPSSAPPEQAAPPPGAESTADAAAPDASGADVAAEVRAAEERAAAEIKAAEEKAAAELKAAQAAVAEAKAAQAAAEAKAAQAAAPPEEDNAAETPALEKAPSAKARAQARAKANSSGKTQKSAGNIRVDLGKLDILQNLVGELIIAENMFRHNPALLEIDDENLTKARAQLIRVTRELQDIATSVRMIPVAATFQKMNRIVRDVSTRQGKKVKIVLDGEYTEVDKTVIEKLSDPLIHLVRNSVDHGVETVDERLIAGKDPIATVTLSAKHQSGEIWITVQDDGKGLNREKILERARSRGLMNGEGGKLKDADVWQFIFEPGFSTAAAVTDISGRGVGMDVVRKNVEALRGRIDVESVTGLGSQFIMRIPLTLAIIEGMLAQVGPQKYTIPMLSVKESINASPEMIRLMPSGSQMLSLRGTLIPILRIDDFHEVECEQVSDLKDGIIVVVEDGNELVGLFVDELIGQFQTVIKPLPSLLGRPRGLAGMCLLANGEISLILDIKAIADGAGDSMPENPEDLEQPAA